VRTTVGSAAIATARRARTVEDEKADDVRAPRRDAQHDQRAWTARELSTDGGVPRAVDLLDGSGRFGAEPALPTSISSHYEGGRVPAAWSRRRSPCTRPSSSKLILVGTGPRGGQGIATLTPEAQQIFGATYDPPGHLWLAVHFGPFEKAQAAGLEFLKRKHLRQVDRDPEVNEKVGERQIEAIVKWGIRREGSYDYLKTIKQHEFRPLIR
jgi:hypothetical protein